MSITNIICTVLHTYPGLWMSLDKNVTYVYRKSKIALPDGGACIARVDVTAVTDDDDDDDVEVEPL